MNYPSIRIEGAIFSPDILDRIEEAPGQRPADFGLDSRQKGQGRDRPCLGRRAGLPAHLPAQARQPEAGIPGHHRNPPAVDRPAARPVRLPADSPRVLLSTGKLVGEGFDHPPLDTLVLAMPISRKGTLRQYAGRLHREHADETRVRIIECVDAGHPALLRMWERRRHGYQAMGCQILSTPATYNPGFELVASNKASSAIPDAGMKAGAK